MCRTLRYAITGSFYDSKKLHTLMKILVNKIVKKLIKKRLKISFAESCTGGLLSSAITSVGGSSKVFSLGLVPYSNQSKINILRVSKNIIKKYGSVSEQVCLSMVKNFKQNQ